MAQRSWNLVFIQYVYLNQRTDLSNSFQTTPDDDFILDKHPAHDNITIAAGFSGHGFKMSPETGEILADLATGQKPKYDLTPFSINRFKK